MHIFLLTRVTYRLMSREALLRILASCVSSLIRTRRLCGALRKQRSQAGTNSLGISITICVESSKAASSSATASSSFNEIVPEDALDVFLVPSWQKVGHVLHLSSIWYRHWLLNAVAGRVSIVFKGSPLMTRVPRVLSPQGGVVRGVAVYLILLPVCLQASLMRCRF